MNLQHQEHMNIRQNEWKLVKSTAVFEQVNANIIFWDGNLYYEMKRVHSQERGEPSWLKQKHVKIHVPFKYSTLTAEEISLPYCPQGRRIISNQNNGSGTSLVVQWLRFHLPAQRTWSWSLVGEDSTCLGASQSVRHNYWAHVLQILKLMCLEPELCKGEATALWVPPTVKGEEVCSHIYELMCLCSHAAPRSWTQHPLAALAPPLCPQVLCASLNVLYSQKELEGWQVNPRPGLWHNIHEVSRAQRLLSMHVGMWHSFLPRRENSLRSFFFFFYQ